MPDKNKVNELIQNSVNSKGKAVNLLKNIKINGGGMDDIKNSSLGKSIEGLGIKVSDFGSIDKLRIELGANAKKITKENIKEAKKEEKRIEKEEKNKKKSSQDPKNKKKNDGKKENKEEVAKNKVKEKVENLSKNVNESLDGNEKLEGVLKEEVEKIIRNKEIRTKEEIQKNLSKKIANSLGSEVNDKIKVESKRIVEESAKWEEKNIETVRDYRRASFKKEFEIEFKSLNPKANEEELKSAREEAQLIANTYYSDRGIENQREAILAAAVATGIAGGGLENAYSNTEGLLGLLQKKPIELRSIMGAYETLSSTISSPPVQLREFRAFDNLMGSLNSDSGLLESFNSAQNKFIGIGSNFNGGGFLGSAGNFISNFGSQDTMSFVSNSIGVFTNGGLSFQQGLGTIIQGFMGNGVKSMATDGFRSMVGGGLNKGISGLLKGVMNKLAKGGMKKLMSGMMSKMGGGWGALINKGIEILKKIGKGLSKGLAKMFGMSDMNPKTQKWMIRLILISLPFLAGMAQNINMASTVVPPVRKEDDYEVIWGEVPECDPYTDTNGILRAIALSVEGMIPYNRTCYKYDKIGIAEIWGRGSPPCGLDCAKFVSWAWFQCLDPIGRGSGGELGGSAHLKSLPNTRPNDWEYIYPKNLDDLRIGDILYKPGHAAIYIGKNPETGVPEIMDTQDPDKKEPRVRGNWLIRDATSRDCNGECSDSDSVADDFCRTYGHYCYTDIIRPVMPEGFY